MKSYSLFYMFLLIKEVILTDFEANCKNLIQRFSRRFIEKKIMTIRDKLSYNLIQIFSKCLSVFSDQVPGAQVFLSTQLYSVPKSFPRRKCPSS